MSFNRIKIGVRILILLFSSLVSLRTAFSQIVINEFSAANYSNFLCSNNQYEDWIELYNAGAGPVNLGGYYLSDRVASPTKWKIPNGIILAAKGRVLFIASGEDKLIGGFWHTNFKVTQTDTKEAIVLASPSGTVIDFNEIDIPNQKNHAYARFPDGGNWVITDTPTPNNPNSSTYIRYAETPDFDIDAGYYSTAQTVTLTTPEPMAEIRYTLDGSDPTTSSNLYTKPIVINNTAVLRCRTYSFNKSIFPSHIEFNTYLIGPNSKHSIKVVSIAGGAGINNLLSGNQSSPEGTFELFDENGVFKDECTGEFNKHGNDSWAYAQRGIDYVTRDQFGNDSEIHNKIFKLSDRKDFQRIILKAAANDNYPAINNSAHIRDAYVHELAQKAHMDLDVRSYEPCVLYVNGAYWGVYELREKVDDKDYTDYYYKLNEKEIDFIKTWGATWAEYGSTAPWDALRTYILGNDMTIPANFKYVSDRLNLQSLADYFIINIHSVCKDWLNWNTSWWHGQDASGNSQKWRYALWDMDATFGHYINYTGIPNINADADPCDIDKLGPNSDPQSHTDVLSKLFQNKSFHDFYINRYADLNNTYLSCDYMTKLLDTLTLRIDPEMPRHINRWGGSYAEWKANIKFMKDFINSRCVEIEGGLVDCYQLKGPYDLTVVVLPQGSPNNVKLNSIIPASYPFNGKYYGGTDLNFSALAGSGWKFDKWKTKQMTIAPGVLAPDVSSQISTPDTLFAYFVVECTTKVTLSTPVTDYLDCNHKSVQLISDVQKGGNSYTYSWKDPNGLIIKDSTQSSINVSQSGPYIVFVNDKVLGCIVSDTIMITDKTIYPNISLSTNEIITCADSAALLLTNGSDVGAQFNYEWKGPCLKSPINNISNEACKAGTYELIITNTQNGCTSSKTISITSDLKIPNDVSINAVATELPCDGNGVPLSISGNGPNGNYTLLWTSSGGALSGNPLSNNISALSTNWYYVEITDPANGCKHKDSIQIIKNTAAPKSLNAIYSNPACTAATNGSIDISNVTGGTAPYNYSINGGPSSGNSNFTMLASGSYLISIIDSKLCKYDSLIVLKIIENLPSDPIINLSGPACNVAKDGSFQVQSITSGTPPYLYSLNGGAYGSQTTFTGMSAGSFILSIKDNNNCIFDTTLILKIDKNIPSDPIINLSGPSCSAALNGNIDISSIGSGTAPYLYSLNGGPFVPSASFTNIAAGSFIISIKDNNGCQFDTTVTLKINENIPSDPIINLSGPSCNVATNGSINIASISSGTPPYQYSLNGGAYGVQSAFNNVSTGAFTISIKDNNNCVFDTTINLKVNLNIPSDPILNITGPSCTVAQNGSIDISGVNNGTPPYAYSINGSPYNTQTNYIGLASGNILLSIKDNNACIFDTTIVMNLQENLPGNLELDLYKPACATGTNGSIEIIAVNGGTGPFDYSLNGATAVTVPLFQNLTEGSYTIKITDTYGCEKDTTILLIGGTPLQLDLGPDLNVEPGTTINVQAIIKGKDITNIDWSPINCANCNNINITVDNDTVITATIQDAGGCTETDKLAINIIRKLEIYAPNAFSPDGDGINDTWGIYTANPLAKITHLQIFDRWGGMVFNVSNLSPDDKNAFWDGRINGKRCNAGVYVYAAEVDLGKGEHVLVKGDINLFH